jgi:hypothetical protein
MAERVDAGEAHLADRPQAAAHFEEMSGIGAQPKGEGRIE